MERFNKGDWVYYFGGYTKGHMHRPLGIVVGDTSTLNAASAGLLVTVPILYMGEDTPIDTLTMLLTTSFDLDEDGKPFCL